jgi:MFS superfamily sulfate permease-like transporter
LGNILSGLIGGLPITQVIVRSSANITFGAKTKMSTILHGLLLLLCITTTPSLLNMIPIATLAAILFVVGYKLAEPIIFVRMYRLGWEQFLPFITTILGIVFEDLLVGIAIGITLAIFIILKNHYKNSHDIFYYEENEKKKIHLTLAEEVSFLNKRSILREFRNIPYGAEIIIDFSRSKVIDHDALETIKNFIDNATSNKINVQCIGESNNVDPD